MQVQVVDDVAPVLMFEAKVRERAGGQVMIASKIWCLKGRKEFHGNSSTATGDDFGQGQR